MKDKEREDRRKRFWHNGTFQLMEVLTPEQAERLLNLREGEMEPCLLSIEVAQQVDTDSPRDHEQEKDHV